MGEVEAGDYSRRRWIEELEVQAQLDAFWRRFSIEYMDTQQNRKKWQKVQRDLRIGDVVMVRDRQPCRNDWDLRMIEGVTTGADGHVRRCTIQMTTPLDEKGIPLKKHSTLERCIQDLVLIMKTESIETDSVNDKQ